MGTYDEVKKDIWEMIKRHIPVGVILLIVLYAGIILFGVSVFNKLTESEKLTKEFIQNLTSIYGWAFISLTIFFIFASVLMYLIYRRKHRINQLEELVKRKVDAFIVQQDEASRDSKFIDINQSVKKTYWVLGVSLTSIVEHEKTLEKMADDNVKIRLCMMNPDIAIEGSCISNMENDLCILKELVDELKDGVIGVDIIHEKVKCVKKDDDILKLYNVLINVMHFNEYYVTATDYQKRIKNSYDNLKLIKESISQKHGKDSIKLEVADSFIPMSMTIADPLETEGRMIVEFHLPFTQYKVLFEISKKDNIELFNVFVDFYNIVWERAKKNNHPPS